ELVAASIDLDRIRASSTRLLVITSDLARRQTRLFDSRTVSVDALMAATAVPGAFPPVDVEGTLLVDGGLASRAPVLEALEADPSVRRALVLMSYAPDEQRSEEHTSELQSRFDLVCRLLLEKKKTRHSFFLNSDNVQLLSHETGW